MKNDATGIRDGRRAIRPVLVSAAATVAGLLLCTLIYGCAFPDNLFATREYSFDQVDEFKTEELVATGKVSEAQLAEWLRARHIVVFNSSYCTTAHSADTSLSRVWRRRKSSPS